MPFCERSSDLFYWRTVFKSQNMDAERHCGFLTYLMFQFIAVIVLIEPQIVSSLAIQSFFKLIFEFFWHNTSSLWELNCVLGSSCPKPGFAYRLGPVSFPVGRWGFSLGARTLLALGVITVKRPFQWTELVSAHVCMYVCVSIKYIIIHRCFH